MADKKKDQLKRKKYLEHDLRRRYRAGELTDRQIAELSEAGFPFESPVKKVPKAVVRIDDGKSWPSCSAAEKELGITHGWMSDVCNAALNDKWIAIKNQFYCFESMYSPDMDLKEIRGKAGWIVNLETGEMFPTTTEAAKAAGTNRSVVLDHAKNKVKPQNRRFAYVRDWDGKIGRPIDQNVRIICLESKHVYHSYNEIWAALYPCDDSKETRKYVVKEVGQALRGERRTGLGLHWATGENFEERNAEFEKEQALLNKPLIEMKSMNEFANMGEALKFSRYGEKRVIELCESRGTDEGAYGYERWCWKEDFDANVEVGSGLHIKELQPVICYEEGDIYNTVESAERLRGVSKKILLSAGKHAKKALGNTWRLLAYDREYKVLRENDEIPITCIETGEMFAGFEQLVDYYKQRYVWRRRDTFELRDSIGHGEFMGNHYQFVLPKSVTGR